MGCVLRMALGSVIAHALEAPRQSCCILGHGYVPRGYVVPLHASDLTHQVFV
jgi:hypothetical protein